MKPQHIATIGVAGVFAAVATSAITFAEFKLVDTGRDVVTAFFLPGRDQLSIVDNSRSSYVASDFEPAAGADGPKIVSELKSELGEDCQKKAPVVEIWATKQRNSGSKRNRVAFARSTPTRALPSPSAREQREIQSAAPTPAMTRASDVPRPSGLGQSPTMVFHFDPSTHPDSAPLANQAALQLANTKLKALEAEFHGKTVWMNMKGFPKVRVMVGAPGTIDVPPADALRVQTFVSEQTMKEFRDAQEEVRRSFEADRAETGDLPSSK